MLQYFNAVSSLLDLQKISIDQAVIVNNLAKL